MNADGSDYGVRRLRMVEEQLVARGLRDEDVLAAMRSVPRHLFVPDDLVSEAYADSPLPIGLGQTISQPYMVAIMTALLGVDVRSRVLEVGSGSGYQTAVLAEVAGEVCAVERLAPLEERARAALTRLGYDNVRLAIGDGARGWHELAPFQGILVAAAADEVPPELLGQLADGGRLVVPVGRSHGDQVLTIVERVGDAFEERHDTRCRFVPLVRDPGPEQRRKDALRSGGADGGSGPGSAGRRRRPRRQLRLGRGGRHEVGGRRGERRGARRVLPLQRAPRGSASRPARLGAQPERRFGRAASSGKRRSCRCHARLVPRGSAGGAGLAAHGQ